MGKGVKRRIRRQLELIGQQLRQSARDDRSRSAFFAAGLRREGYVGGYEQALMDILLLMNGVQPQTRQAEGWWPEEQGDGTRANG